MTCSMTIPGRDQEVLPHGWTMTANVVRKTGSRVLNGSSGGKGTKETLWQNEELQGSEGREG